MLVKEFYDSVGGDYNQVLNQLGDDDTILEFLKKFFAKDEITSFKEFLANKKYKEAFMCIHNIKGYGLNMALVPLYETADVLCEALRHGKPVIDIEPMVKALCVAYDEISIALAKV